MIDDTLRAPLEIRPFRPGEDSVEEITAILHAAYAPLRDRGLHFVASWQPPERTLERMNDGRGLVARHAGRIVGTITWYEPGRTGGGTPWYERTDVAKFGQFAIDPAHQGKGWGRALERHVARDAFALGARELALDTSENATELIELYTRWGYRFVEHCRWREVNYRSVVMSRTLSAALSAG